MKEYLTKNSNAEYQLVNHRFSDEDIEVPDGAESYWVPYVDNSLGTTEHFFKREGDEFFYKYLTSKEWLVWADYINSPHQNFSCVWKRHTQPEELPFIDDDFIENNFKDWSVEMQDHEFKFSGIRVEQFTDVKKTLNERQSSYGCFEDVASTTCRLLEVLGQARPNGLSELPYTHQEALHMIASKMARIVNGDFNHKDSWHDIQGYAKLIEDLL